VEVESRPKSGALPNISRQNSVATVGEVENIPSQANRETTKNNQQIVFLVLGLLIPILACSPILFLSAKDLWAQLPFRFFPLAILAGTYFLYSTCVPGTASRVRTTVSTLIILLGFGLAIWGLYIVSNTRVHLAALLIVTGWSLRALGRTSWLRIISICSLFFVTLPIPFGISTRVIQTLHKIAGSACNGLLEAIYVPSVFEENVLRAEGVELAVLEKCLDAGSCFALLAFAIAWLVWWRRPLLVGMIVAASVFLFSLIGDMVRLLVLTFASQNWNVDLGAGIPGIALGIAIFLLTMLFVIACDISISAIFAPIVLDRESTSVMKAYQGIVNWPPERGDQAEKPAAVASSRFDWVLALPVVLCLILGMVATWVLFIRSQPMTRVQTFGQEQANLLPSEDVFPEQIGALKRLKYSTESRETSGMLGKYSHTWQFDGGDTQVLVSLDSPLAGWTSPAGFYALFGWEIENENYLEMDNDVAWTVEELTMRNRFGVTANAWSALFDETGRPVQRNNDAAPKRETLLSMLINSSGQIDTPVHFHVRMFFESGRRLSDDELKEYRNFFVELFSRLRQQSAESLKKLR
jgi:hypothetical protein